MKEKLLILEGTSCFECPHKDECGWEPESILCQMDVDNILTLITEEIEKVENKWLNKDIDSEGEYAVLCYNREKGFEECRQMILALLKE